VDIYDRIIESGFLVNQENLLGSSKDIFCTLAKLLERSSLPKERAETGVADYCKVYQVICRFYDNCVIIYC
jgi:hypothetical protein